MMCAMCWMWPFGHTADGWRAEAPKALRWLQAPRVHLTWYVWKRCIPTNFYGNVNGERDEKPSIFTHVGIPYFWDAIFLWIFWNHRFLQIHILHHTSALLRRRTSERQLLSELAIIVRPQLASATSQVQQVGSPPHVSIDEACQEGC